MDSLLLRNNSAIKKSEQNHRPLAEKDSGLTMQQLLIHTTTSHPLKAYKVFILMIKMSNQTHIKTSILNVVHIIS